MALGFEPTSWIWRNGEMIRWEDATIHVLSHVVHYGSSVFEGIRAYKTPDGPAIFRLREHVRRFEDSAKIYRMDLGFSQDAMAEACEAIVRQNDMDECYIRPIAFRGFGTPGINPHTCPVEVYVMCWYWGAYLGTEGMARGIDAGVSSWHRMAPNTFPSIAKAGGNYLAAQLMKMEALANGYDEAIALGHGGMLSEGSGQNLFLVRDGKLLTASLDGTFLPGITRDAIITIARDAGIPIIEGAIPREMIYIADEAFFSGTAAEVTPIRSVDRITIGNGERGEITALLQDKLLGIARGRYPDEYGWLWPVKAEAGVA